MDRHCAHSLEGLSPGLLAAALILGVTVPAAPAAAVEIQEIVTPKGIRAWFVPDDTVPIVTLRFAFTGGSAQEPRGKEGLANLMTGLFDEGAGGLDARAFQERLDDSGAEVGFSEGRDALFGSMRTLASSRDEAFDLLRLAVNEPRFDAAPFERIRGQILSGIKAGARDPERLAQDRWRTALYGDHPYARDDNGSETSLNSITQADLRAFHEAQFARSNLVIGVVGAIDAETLKGKLDAVFGALPEKAELAPVADVAPKLAQDVRFPYPLPQATVALVFPGISREDPGYFAAYLMTEILGGDGLGSRLFEEVREKRGLAYGVSASLVDYDHADLLSVSTATNASRAGETLGVIRETVARMAAEGPTDEELERAKRYVIGAYAINALDSSGSIANTLVQLQLDHLGIDYIDKRAGLINAVTVAAARRAARDLLSAKPAVLVVGPEAGKAAP